MANINISVDEFLTECSISERKEIILAMVEDGFLPKWVIKDDGKVISDVGKTNSEINFISNLEELKTKFYSLTTDEEEFLDRIFRKYLQ